MIGDNKTLRDEMEKLVDDIRAAYEDSGKKVSGEFSKGLKVTYNSRGATLSGYAYLAGRKAGGVPPIDIIKKWVEARGIRGRRPEMTSTMVAKAIAFSIANNGTLAENHKAIYDEVVTPQRIQSIVDKVSAINVQEFTNAVTIEMKKLTTNI